MKRLFLPILLLLSILCASGCASRSRGIPVIIETDMGNDVDDALALAVALNAMNQGRLDVKLVSVHKDSPTACAYVDMVNTFYGHPEIPVAYCSTPVRNGDARDFTAPVVDSGRYPRSHSSYPESVGEYRRILSGARDSSVVVISLGFGTTLAQLLDSDRDLVARKVKLLSIMAGSYGPQDTLLFGGVRDTLFDGSVKRSEFNVWNDTTAMRKVFAQWPGRVVQNPFELGKMVKYPGKTAFAQEGDPVFDGYKAYRDKVYDRPSWDLLSVVYVLEPQYFLVSDPATVSVDDRGFTQIAPGGQHRVLSIPEGSADALRELEVALTLH